MIAAVSADGFIGQDLAAPSTDWTSAEDKQFFRERTKKAGVMIMGSTTFKTIGRPLKDRLIIVLSTQPKPAEYSQYDDSQIRFSSLQPSQLLSELAAEGFSEVALCGGASVYTQFLQQGLVNTLYLTIEPILFGIGIPLFREMINNKTLNLKNVTRLGTDTVLLEYTV